MPDARVTGLWMEPTATHALVTVTVGSALGSTTEMHYVHAKWKKPRVLSKLKQKGLSITAAAWNHAKLSEASSGCVSCRVCLSRGIRAPDAILATLLWQGWQDETIPELNASMRLWLINCTCLQACHPWH